MKVDKQLLAELDKKMLYDFFSLGAWTHQYTATALYHEAQRITVDETIMQDDRPRVQLVLRAKILAEVVASMETLGKFCYAVRERKNGSGFSALFVNTLNDKGKIINPANEFYRLVKDTETLHDDELTDLLNLPPQHYLQTINSDIKDFMGNLASSLKEIAEEYLDPQEDKALSRRLVSTYNAIKHGSHIVNNPVTLSPIPIDIERQVVTFVVHWPLPGDEITGTTMRFTTRSLAPDVVVQDLTFIRNVAIILSNLCQLLIVMLDRTTWFYDTQ